MYNEENMMLVAHQEAELEHELIDFGEGFWDSPDSDETQEIDLESVAGRAFLMQEIENVALTCDTADDPALFVESDVYSLVAELQAALFMIEESQLFDEAVTCEQADIVQKLYDQLAVEVERPSIVSVYVGPTRKDMLLQDLSDEGSITITFTPPKQQVEELVPVPKKTYIHNSLPIKPAGTLVPVESVLTPREPKPLYKTDAPEVALQKLIDSIEAAEVSFLDAWINDYQSPYKALGDMQFAELQNLALAPVHSRSYLEFKNLLEQQKIKYEVFNQWSQDFAVMEQVVERSKYKTFKQVVDEYLIAILAS
jgi:hypothetical protein